MTVVPTRQPSQSIGGLTMHQGGQRRYKSGCSFPMSTLWTTGMQQFILCPQCDLMSMMGTNNLRKGVGYDFRYMRKNTEYLVCGLCSPVLAAIATSSWRTFEWTLRSVFLHALLASALLTRFHQDLDWLSCLRSPTFQRVYIVTCVSQDIAASVVCFF